MPTAPLRPCPMPGCPTLTPGGRCSAHASAQRQADDRARAYDHAERYGARHRRWRELVLARCPLCVVCGRPAVVADHTIALEDGGDWSLANGQGMCVADHNAKSVRERMRRGVKSPDPGAS